MAATLVASPVLAADSTTAPRPALIYQLPDSKRCGTLTTACDIPKDVNAGGALNSSSVNSTNVTATGGVTAPVITAPGGGPIQAHVTQSDDSARADQADNATRASSSAVADTSKALDPDAAVRGDQVKGAVEEAETALAVSGGGLIKVTYINIDRDEYGRETKTTVTTGAPPVSGRFSGNKLVETYYATMILYDEPPVTTCNDNSSGNGGCTTSSYVYVHAQCRITSAGAKTVYWSYTDWVNGSVIKYRTKTTAVGESPSDDWTQLKVTTCG